jgi:hypothetical protein
MQKALRQFQLQQKHTQNTSENPNKNQQTSTIQKNTSSRGKQWEFKSTERKNISKK